MSKRALHIAVYPLLLVNLALGFLMFVLSHQFILVAVASMNRAGLFDHGDLGPFSYINQSVNGLGIVMLGLLALISFPILESYYARNLERGQELLRRFLFAVGIQLCYLSIVQLGIRALVGFLFPVDFGLALMLLQLAGGVSIVLWARSKAKSMSRNREYGPLKMRDDH